MRPLVLSLFVVVAAAAGCAGPLPEVCAPETSRTPAPLSATGAGGLLVHAHAHNDYEHDHPLTDALAAGFHSVEADVYYSGGRFEVSHTGFGSKGTLKDLYLDPLQAKVEENGSVLGDGAGFILWIDIKDSDPHFADDLSTLLDGYSMLTTFDHGSVSPGEVTVVLTGDAGMKRAFVEQHPRRKAIRDSNDFSLKDPSADTAWAYYALDWGKYLAWDGSGALPDDQAERLTCLVNAAHAKGYKVRLYNTPDNQAVWQASVEHGGDFINSDHLTELGAFLSK